MEVQRVWYGPIKKQCENYLQHGREWYQSCDPVMEDVGCETMENSFKDICTCDFFPENK